MTIHTIDRTAISAAVLDTLRRVLEDRGADIPDIPMSMLLYDADGTGADSLDLDSLDALELVGVLEDQLDFELSDEADLAELRTVGDLVSGIEAELQKQPAG